MKRPLSFKIDHLTLCATLAFAVSCSDDDPSSPTPDVDTTPPSRVADLAASAVGDSAITLTWHAPGDDSLAGRASLYDIRYSTEALTTENWENADSVAAPPSPGSPGSPESFVVEGLSSDGIYHFGIKTADEVPNWSAPSTVLATTAIGLCAPSAPDSLLCSIESIYMDQMRPAAARLALYDGIFDRGFRFRFQLADIKLGLPPSWDIDSEIAAHNAMFSAQDQGNVYSIDLAITHGQATDLDPPQQGREGWKEIFASHVYLRLMFNLEDGLEVNGGQAEFLFPPPVGGRWYIAEWSDLPRPEPGLIAIESATWGHIKANFR